MVTNIKVVKNWHREVSDIPNEWGLKCQKAVGWTGLKCINCNKVFQLKELVYSLDGTASYDAPIMCQKCVAYFVW